MTPDICDPSGNWEAVEETYFVIGGSEEGGATNQITKYKQHYLWADTSLLK